MSLWNELNAAGRAVAVAILSSGVLLVIIVALNLIPVSRVSYVSDLAAATASAISQNAIPAKHVATPAAVKGIYMTACVASGRNIRDKILETIAGTEINSIVIDVKDYTGTISYSDTEVLGPKGRGCRITDLPEFLAELHAKGIYAIGRVTVFQDPLYALYKPDMAVQSMSELGRPWKDKSGLSYIDPDSTPYWQYIAAIAKEAHTIGFDEINFDYIRFPSDGDMSDVQFALPVDATKASVITSFFKYLSSELQPLGITTSADLFGQTTVNRDDMGIGQILENALPYFDYVSPMDYPSHYVDGFLGYDKPALKPYEIVNETMMSAVERTVTASSSVSKLRPWLQAFDLGAVYTPEMVQAQIQAIYHSGVNGWMLWDAGNRYTKAEL